MSERAALADAPARERVRTDLARTLFVEAGAGTGKTSALVERVVELVATGRVAMRDIAAITFTEAAAAELQVRTHGELTARLRVDPGNVRLATALGELDEAAITTIHGFARRILAEFPLEAGLPLRFRVLDELEEQRQFEGRFAQLLDALLDDESSRFLAGAALALGIGAAQLRGLARLVEAHWNELGERALPVAATELETEVLCGVEDVRRALAGATALAGHCSDPDDRLLGVLESLAEELGTLATTSDALEQLEWLARLDVPLGARTGRTPAWSNVGIATVRAELETARTMLETVRASLCDATLQLLIARLSSEAVIGARRRASAGELSFQDLLVHAHRLVATDAAVRRRLAERYGAILVDEFQDTDPLQLALVGLLADDGNGGLAPGKLFFVGDPKQAIYRFRGADRALYRGAQARTSTDEQVALTTSFRSVPGICAFVNATFALLLGADDEGSGYTGLVAARTSEHDAAPVLLLGGAIPERIGAPARRALESAELAETIAAAIEEAWPVRDRETDELRAARLGDIAILVPTRTGLGPLEAALDARRIAYRIESPGLLYASSEIRDLLACLACLAHPADEVAIVAALRSGLLACSDEELLEHRRAGGSWRLGSDVRSGRVGALLGYLADLRARSLRQSCSATLGCLVSERFARELAASSPHPLDAQRRIEFLFAEVGAFEDDGGVDLVEFLEFATRRATDGRSALEAVSATLPVEAVRILTIHGAKGLEFPIVALAELGGAIAGRQRSPALLVDRGRAEVRVRSGCETSGFAALAAAEAVHEEAEARRLCYVGATRARDYLLICLHHERDERARSFAAELSAVVGGHEHLWRRPVARAVVDRSAGPAVPAVRIEEEAEYLAASARRRALVARANTSRSVAASYLGEEPPRAPATERAETEDEPDLLRAASRRAATALGRAVHGVLERVELARPEAIGALAAELSASEHCESEEARVAELARACLASPAVRAGLGAARHWRELPLTYAIGEVVLEGIVDLLYEEADGSLVLVDYKTDRIEEGADLGRRIEHYRLQLGAYALGLELLLGRQVARCVLVFAAAPGGPREESFSEITALVDAARRELVGPAG